MDGYQSIKIGLAGICVWVSMQLGGIVILSILVDTFLQGYQCLSSIQRFIESLSFNHRRQPLISGAYPPVVPIADEISKDEGFHFLHCHFLCIMPPIEEFLFHPCPHALAPCVVMAASSGAVHTLTNTVFCNRPAISFAGVLGSTVRVDHGSLKSWISADGIVKCPLT